MVQAYPRAGRRAQISSGGANSTWWSRDSKQIVYTGNDSHELWRVDLEASGDTIRAGTPTRLGTLPDGLVIGAIDAMPDLKRFLALVPDRTGTDSITVLENWMGAIAKR